MPGIEALPPRIAAKIHVGVGCWEWTAAKGANGYGHVYWQGRVWEAHRLVYTLLVGPVEDGMVIDHDCHNADLTCAGGPTCRHRLCQNPEHMQPTTRSQNMMNGRGPWARNAHATHCVNGHEFTAENTVMEGVWRRCVACRRERDRKRRPRGRPRTDTPRRGTFFPRPNAR